MPLELESAPSLWVVLPSTDAPLADGAGCHLLIWQPGCVSRITSSPLGVGPLVVRGP